MWKRRMEHLYRLSYRSYSEMSIFHLNNDRLEDIIGIGDLSLK